MISLEKATRFIQKTACKAGLIMLPLAAAGIGYAGTISSPALPADVFTFGSLGAGTLQGVSSNTVAGISGSTATFVLSSTGTLVGASLASGTTIPVSYDVDASVSSWNLDFELLDGSTVIADSGVVTGPDSGAVAITTSATALVNDTLTEQVTLNVFLNQAFSDAAVAQSIGTQGLGTPEPGTLGLTGSVLAMAAFYLRRRKRAIQN